MDAKIEKGSVISFQIGLIRNPISTAPVTGFKVETFSYLYGKLGDIAIGAGTLTVSDPAIVGSGPETVSLRASETLINRVSNFIIEFDVPLPLNAGCQIELTIPKPLFIGPDLTRVQIAGMFGSIRQPNLALDADNGIINIDGACPSYR